MGNSGSMSDAGRGLSVSSVKRALLLVRGVQVLAISCNEVH